LVDIEHFLLSASQFWFGLFVTEFNYA